MAEWISVGLNLVILWRLYELTAATITLQGHADILGQAVKQMHDAVFQP